VFCKDVIMKPVRRWENWCTVCESFLGGHGSVGYPYRCLCGEYDFDFRLGRYKHPKEVK
jgi:hypothetical protein